VGTARHFETFFEDRNRTMWTVEKYRILFVAASLPIISNFLFVLSGRFASLTIPKATC
jgi:hypothetical protein